MIQITTLYTQLFTAAAMALAYLAHLYDTVGYGLNPWIALPIATFLMILPHILNYYLIEVVPDEDELPEELSCVQFRNQTGRW